MYLHISVRGCTTKISLCIVKCNGMQENAAGQLKVKWWSHRWQEMKYFWHRSFVITTSADSTLSRKPAEVPTIFLSLQNLATWCTSSPGRSTSSWRRWRRKSLPDWNGYNSITGEVLIKTIKDYQNDKDCYWHYGRSIGAFKNIRMHIIIKQEGDKNEVE